MRNVFLDANVVITTWDKNPKAWDKSEEPPRDDGEPPHDEKEIARAVLQTSNTFFKKHECP